ncbi:esterase/lipase family protein [Streptomyces clavuligerus]|uniref:esterase/lipase family protein n=1 Tax=Streptomyces clavuligerus TaxID=1901 RepID=UPI00020D93A3|nr:hypothetical protein [Streptomyces clavuligerus]WDN56054.1 GPI inositol-deacylase [Streptomyces clavuligerus]
MYFIPGYDRDGAPGVDCKEYWKPLPDAMRQWGFAGAFHTVGFYRGDTNCDVRIAQGDHDVRVRTLGRLLANHIYNNYSSKGRYVDLAGHSMGGLIARAALSGVQKQVPGFPPRLLVDDVVTFDTGHKGVAFASFCETNQCVDMRSGSYFLTRWALNNPQGAGGTDWTLLSVSEMWFDKVSQSSALGMNSPHFVHYSGTTSIDHGNMPNITTGTYLLRYRNSPAGWVLQRGAAPGRVAATALFSNRW